MMTTFKLFLTFAVILLTGCATVENNYDPIEPVNRGVYKLNKGIDTILLKPVAQGYDFVTPDIVQTGVGNFFSNLGEIRTVANDILQFKLGQAANDTTRFVINSTFGLAGLMDVASAVGFEEHDEDFGQTLGVWGIENAPYFVIPILGPSTFRDAPALVADIFLDPLFYCPEPWVTYPLKGLQVVQTRASLLDYDDVLKEQVDEYAFVRDAYLQKRKAEINDGEVEDLEGFEFIE